MIRSGYLLAGSGEVEIADGYGTFMAAGVGPVDRAWFAATEIDLG